MKRIVALLILIAGCSASQVTATRPEGDCGFAKLQPRQISHYVERGALTKVEPQYPLAAKAAGTTGSVRVRILINRAGLVERTCPEYVADQLRPSRSLMVAAEAAALQWRFDPNFGFVSGGALRFKYVEGVLVFNFVLDSSDGTTGRR